MKTIKLTAMGRVIFGSALAVLFPLSTALANEGGKNGGLPQFNAEWFPSQLFWLTVTFAILYVFFARYGLPRVQNAIEFRQKSIQSDLDSAAELSARAKEIRENYERSMARARDRASETLRQANEQIKEKTADMLYAYRTKFTQEITHTENELQLLKNNLMPEMQTIAAEAAAHAASTILHAPADLDQAQNIVETLVKKQEAA